MGSNSGVVSLTFSMSCDQFLNEKLQKAKLPQILIASVHMTAVQFGSGSRHYNMGEKGERDEAR